MKTFELMVAAATLLLPLAALADEKAQIQAVIKRHEDFVAAWNRHDARALAELWVDSGDLIDAWGVWGKGRAAMKNSTWRGEVKDGVLLYPDAAVVNAEAEISGILGPGNQG
jgi:hypothetical protein